MHCHAMGVPTTLTRNQRYVEITFPCGGTVVTISTQNLNRGEFPPFMLGSAIPDYQSLGISELET